MNTDSRIYDPLYQCESVAMKFSRARTRHSSLADHWPLTTDHWSYAGTTRKLMSTAGAEWVSWPTEM